MTGSTSGKTPRSPTVSCNPNHGRSYFTRAEKLEWLVSYKSRLEAELKGVEERIAELTAAETGVADSV